MKKLFTTALPIGLALLSVPASARTFISPGTVCQPVGGSTCIRYDEYGVHNACSSEQTVECPLVHTAPNSSVPNVWQAYLKVYDRHSTQNLSCALEKRDGDGGLMYSSTRSTSGEGAASRFMLWSSVGQAQDWAWRVRCTIPGIESGEISHLTTAVLLTTE